ncbi:MAG: sigma-54-dependent Fis family transcriptional regulator [Deltaproteobacteria bacterium]|nr:sigma-54-dependent Fis family transcriptional regulator [Deltaproteobacteria bacterium]MBI3389279.1 sigma-54-dependent Fis family transcriptional regulator [Deltaproteobacteria bacterium]
MSTGSILVVDDNLDNRRLLRLSLGKVGYTVHVAESGAEALDLFRKTPIDLSVIDLQMPGMDGITLLKELRRLEPNAQVIVMTAYGSVERAVEAMKAGAMDFLTRPVRREVLLALVEKGIDVGHMVAENRRLRSEVVEKYDFSQLVGRSPQMQQVLALAAEAAQRDVIVLISGESGVGKEVLARAIHYNSTRRSGPFFALNCAAITETLMESELFGHERGSFTGAERRKSGLLEQAAHGTLLLDEIGDMPITAQAKLLRVIETREMLPVGGTRPVRVNARLIAATNAELRQRAQAKQFREDLFFRLNVFAIHIPPLRERRDDILPLGMHILGRLARETGKDLPGFSQDAVDYLMQAPWDGNVRELANAIERAVIVSRGNLITQADFPQDQLQRPHPPQSEGISIPSDGLKMDDVERSLLLQALERTGRNLSRAARLLGMGRGALRYRLDKYGITVRDTSE